MYTTDKQCSIFLRRLCHSEFFTSSWVWEKRNMTQWIWAQGLVDTITNTQLFKTYLNALKSPKATIVTVDPQQVSDLRVIWEGWLWSAAKQNLARRPGWEPRTAGICCLWTPAGRSGAGWRKARATAACASAATPSLSVARSKTVYFKIGIRTVILWWHKQLLCQLSRDHYPRVTVSSILCHEENDAIVN